MKQGLIVCTLLLACGGAGYQVSGVPQPQGKSIPAIYAAGQISHAAIRNQSLQELAARQDLTEAELLYIIDIVEIRKGSSDLLKDLLLTILSNPAETFKVRQRVSGILPNLRLTAADQQEIVEALINRKKQPEQILPKPPPEEPEE